jgi:hypothetical protein
LTVLGGLLQLVIPEFFEIIIHDGKFHSLIEDSQTIFNTLGISLGVILLILGGWNILTAYPNVIASLEKIFLVRWLISASKAGFYLESIWMGLWAGLKKTSYEFRKTHTGDLNYTMFGAAIVSFGIVLYIVGG